MLTLAGLSLTNVCVLCREAALLAAQLPSTSPATTFPEAGGKREPASTEKRSQDVSTSATTTTSSATTFNSIVLRSREVPRGSGFML